MLPRVRRVLAEWLAAGARSIGQVEIRQNENGFALFHREDAARDDLTILRSPNDAEKLAKFDDAGNFRPLKTAPNLRHGWRLEVADLAGLQLALDLFYPGRLAALAAWEANRLTPTPLRATLDRQTGMYRAAAKFPTSRWTPWWDASAARKAGRRDVCARFCGRAMRVAPGPPCGSRSTSSSRRSTRPAQAKT